jgi:DNA invertase Pin-like site-specific DNA recombinase
MGTPPNTAAIYVRRSAFDAGNTEADAFSRSLAAQERECLAWAERQGLTVTEVYRDKTGTSASHLKTNRRPEMERALADIGTSYHTLIVWAFDRATRKGIAEAGSMLETVEKAGGRLVSVTDGVDTDDPTARLIIAIRAEMARDEMTKLSTRVNRGKDEQRRRGEYLGGSLQYGLLRDKDAEYGVSVDHEAAEVLRRAVDMLIAGSSLTETCGALNADGARTSTGAMWTATTLRRVVRSPHMLGHRYYKAQDIYAADDDGNRLVVHEPIIDEATFRRVDKAVAARAKVTNNSNRKQTVGEAARQPPGWHRPVRQLSVNIQVRGTAPWRNYLLPVHGSAPRPTSTRPTSITTSPGLLSCSCHRWTPSPPSSRKSADAGWPGSPRTRSTATANSATRSTPWRVATVNSRPPTSSGARWTPTCSSASTGSWPGRSLTSATSCGTPRRTSG